MRIRIKFINGTEKNIEIDDESTVLNIMKCIENDCEIPCSQQKLIYKGKILHDDQNIIDANITDNCLIILCVSPSKTQPTPKIFPKISMAESYEPEPIPDQEFEPDLVEGQTQYPEQEPSGNIFDNLLTFAEHIMQGARVIDTNQQTNNPPPRNPRDVTVEFTEEDFMNIQNLMEIIGKSRDETIMAYIRCYKNYEMAANLLLGD